MSTEQPVMPVLRWVVVRRSRTILGGWRIVGSPTTETQARALAASYKRSHEAMSLARLTELRIAAIKVSEGPGEGQPG